MLKITVSCLSVWCAALTVVGAVVSPASAQTQTTQQAPNGELIEDQNQDELRPLAQSDSLLSLEGGEKLMQEASEAISSEQYEVAAAKLNQARRVFNQLSNYHLKLANIFSGIDRAVVEAQRNNALKSGQLRDQATYQLALVHRAQNQPELAVPLLIQVIESQNPTSEMGKKSYQQLYELGFVSAPMSPPAPASSSSAPIPSAQR
ncbi:conserved hypothetical protein [Gloeothece citriformis PCC 7424]|uniref:Uncharacterized protein n=1 Tax=Gloeothece citriformis (strain PCC 7424) TaxID=65393 RepID=B7KIC6_GLOC7|nr:hypothetical protein [Gloeothece citriformis]ACK73613.1 conserved hypothetical protein [Gloeothece citriformis PCC 7424]